MRSVGQLMKALERRWSSVFPQRGRILLLSLERRQLGIACTRCKEALCVRDANSLHALVARGSAIGDTVPLARTFHVCEDLAA